MQPDRKSLRQFHHQLELSADRFDVVAPTRGIHLHVRLYRDFEKLGEVTNDRTVAYIVSFDTTFKKGVVFDRP
jgi:hypothetical protein